MTEERFVINYLYNTGNAKYTVSKKSNGPSEFLSMPQDLSKLMEYLWENKETFGKNKPDLSNNFPHEEKAFLDLFIRFLQ